jgi:hypothetical protein
MLAIMRAQTIFPVSQPPKDYESVWAPFKAGHPQLYSWAHALITGGPVLYFAEMIEVFATSWTVVITVAPIIGLPPVQGIGVRLAGIGIDWQPDGELAALFDSVSVSVGASVAHCYAVSFESFPRKSDSTLGRIRRRRRSGRMA